MQATQLKSPVNAGTFTELPFWSEIGDGWSPVHGSIRETGASFEWHDFKTRRELDWGNSFHPGCVEVCLNLEGHGTVALDHHEISIAPLTAGYYRRCGQPLRAVRAGGQRHRFLTVEMSFDFLRRHLAPSVASLHPIVQEAVLGKADRSAVAGTTRLTARHQQLIAGLRRAPILASARTVWYQAKALEVAAEFFFVTPAGQELFCQRQQRLATERVEKVIAILRRDLALPPTLEEIGRSIGCSPFHLSRTFSAAMSMTIPQYLRQLRMERAAELLRSGKFNVTEAAFEVGYSSLSHFSQAFHETFGCCPGLYPMRTPSQKDLPKPTR